jgi:hypothetical protein
MGVNFIWSADSGLSPHLPFLWIPAGMEYGEYINLVVGRIKNNNVRVIFENGLSAGVVYFWKLKRLINNAFSEFLVCSEKPSSQFFASF